MEMCVGLDGRRRRVVAVAVVTVVVAMGVRVGHGAVSVLVRHCGPRHDRHPRRGEHERRRSSAVDALTDDRPGQEDAHERGRSEDCLATCGADEAGAGDPQHDRGAIADRADPQRGEGGCKCRCPVGEEREPNCEVDGARDDTFAAVIWAGVNASRSAVVALSMPQPMHAPTTSRAAGLTLAPPLHVERIPAASTSAIPPRVRRSMRSPYAAHATVTVATSSRFKRMDTVDDGTLARPANSNTGDTPPPITTTTTMRAQSARVRARPRCPMAMGPAVRAAPR